MCIFFLHVPKTAGQSFRKAAIDYFDEEKVALLYGEDSPTTTKELNNIFYKNRELVLKEKFNLISDFIEKNDIRFFSSHASATQLPIFKAENAVIFFREPFERIISHYNYAYKKGHFNESFEKFIENPAYQNLHAKLLSYIDIKSIKFIGLTEKYYESIHLFNLTFNTELKVYHKNKLSFFSKKVSRKKISKDLENKIRKINNKDFLLYEEAKRIYKNRVEKYL